MMLLRLMRKNFDLVFIRTMNTLFLSIVGGILACLIYWTDHTVIRSDQEPIENMTLVKTFSAGFIISYVISVFSYQPENVTSVPSMNDAIKTGVPSF